jgi:hypothetical protein
MGRKCDKPKITHFPSVPYSQEDVLPEASLRAVKAKPKHPKVKGGERRLREKLKAEREKRIQGTRTARFVSLIELYTFT